MRKFNITLKRKLIFIITICIILLGFIGMVVSYIFRDNPNIGIRWGIDFTGGTVFNVSLMRDVEDSDLTEISDIVTQVTGETPSLVQKTTVSAVDTSILNSTDIIVIKCTTDESDERKEIIRLIAEQFGLPYPDETGGEESSIDASKIDWVLSIDSVGPAAAADLMKSAVLAIFAASLLMLVYISIRFDLFSGIAAVFALLHDISMMIIFNFIFGVQVNLPFIAAVLTILGYSINATIIIFDRIRENNKLMVAKSNFSEIVNTSVWQTFRRSVFTSLTTLFTIVVLYVLSVPSIKEFSLPIIIGIIAGFVSSVFISGNVWIILKEASEKRKAKE